MFASGEFQDPGVLGLSVSCGEDNVTVSWMVKGLSVPAEVTVQYICTNDSSVSLLL